MTINRKPLFAAFLACLLVITAGCFSRENQTFQKLNKILESGNAAVRAEQFDKAIKFYDAGLKIAPTELVILNNKSIALRLRGINTYNKSIRIEDKQAKTDGFNAAKKDISDACLVSSEAMKILKEMSSVKLYILESIEDAKLRTLESHAENMRLLATIVDPSKSDDALAASSEYAAVQPDQEKKLKIQLAAAKMLLDSGNGQKAFVEYKKLLDSDPNNLDARLGVGMALAHSGQKDDFQEAKRHIRQFVNEAPANHPSMAIAQEILNSMQ